MARLLLAYLVVFALTVSTPSRADFVSCILFQNYVVPYATYKTVHTQDTGACCRLCADDVNCVAWTRDHDGRCSLKNDAQFLVQVGGVDSGIKYSGAGNPTLSDNPVGASVLIIKADAPKRRPAGGGTVVRASVRASTTGGRVGGRVTASNRGVTSQSFVEGSGTVQTSGSSPTVSLATLLSAEDGREKAKIAVVYYPSPVVLGQVNTIKGVHIPIISDGNGQIYCYKCAESPCVYSQGLSFKGKGKVISDFTIDSRDACCRACKNNPKCVTWWYSLKKRCVLNSDIPERLSIANHAGGLYL